MSASPAYFQQSLSLSEIRTIESHCISFPLPPVQKTRYYTVLICRKLAPLPAYVQPSLLAPFFAPVRSPVSILFHSHYSRFAQFLIPFSAALAAQGPHRSGIPCGQNVRSRARFQECKTSETGARVSDTLQALSQQLSEVSQKFRVYGVV